MAKFSKYVQSTKRGKMVKILKLFELTEVWNKAEGGGGKEDALSVGQGNEEPTTITSPCITKLESKY